MSWSGRWCSHIYELEWTLVLVIAVVGVEAGARGWCSHIYELEWTLLLVTALVGVRGWCSPQSLTVCDLFLYGRVSMGCNLARCSRAVAVPCGVYSVCVASVCCEGTWKCVCAGACVAFCLTQCVTTVYGCNLALCSRAVAFPCVCV